MLDKLKIFRGGSIEEVVEQYNEAAKSDLFICSDWQIVQTDHRSGPIALVCRVIEIDLDEMTEAEQESFQFMHPFRIDIPMPHIPNLS